MPGDTTEDREMETEIAAFEADLAGEAIAPDPLAGTEVGQLAVKSTWVDDSMDVWLDGVEPNWFCFTD